MRRCPRQVAALSAQLRQLVPAGAEIEASMLALREASRRQGLGLGPDGACRSAEQRRLRRLSLGRSDDGRSRAPSSPRSVEPEDPHIY